MKTHRKKYLKAYGSIPNGWEIHHIDWNPKNNSLSNLIAVPKSVHIYIHKNGYKSRKEIIKLLKSREFKPHMDGTEMDRSTGNHFVDSRRTIHLAMMDVERKRDKSFGHKRNSPPSRYRHQLKLKSLIDSYRKTGIVSE